MAKTIDEQLKEKLDKLLKLNEYIDVKPPSPPEVVSPGVGLSLGGETHQGNVAELINKQTEMIIEVIKALVEHQNKVISELISLQKSNVVPPIQKVEFQEKVISLSFDEKGNPVGAEIKLKPFDENKLNLEYLEGKDSINMS